MDELLEKLATIDQQLDALLALESLTEDQKAEHDLLVEQHTATVEAIEKERDRLAREQQREQLKLDAELAKAKAAEQQRKKDELAKRTVAPAPTVMPGSNRLTTPDLPPAALPGIRTTIPANVKRITPRNFAGTRNGLSADERCYRFGMWCLSRLSQDMPNRFRFSHAVDFVNREMVAVGSNDSSGYSYLIPEEFGMDLIDLRETYGVVRRLFKIVPMTSDTRTDPRRQSGLTAYFVAENAAGIESNKVWNDVRLTAKDLMVLARYSNQVNADAVMSVGDDLAKEIAYAFSLKEDQCGIIGDGTSTYGGIWGIRTKLDSIDGAGTDSAGLVTAAATGSWGAIVLSDFNNVIGKLPQFADMGDVSWVCHKSFYHAVMQKLEMAAGGVTSFEVAGAGQGQRRPRPMFAGYPVDFSQVMPGVTAATGIVALLGNYAMAASFGDRQQDSISFSEHATIGGESLFERNQVGIRGTERFDINVHDVGDSSTPGPVCGLKVG